MASVYGYSTPGSGSVFFKETPPVWKGNVGGVWHFLSTNPETQLFAHVVRVAGLCDELDHIMYNSTIFVPLDSFLVEKHGAAAFDDICQERAFNIVRYSTLANKIEYWALATLNYSVLFPKRSHDRIELVNADGEIRLNGDVRVARSDTVCNNGVVLYTDDVLVPFSRD